MKKRLALMLSAAFMVSLAACGGGGEDNLTASKWVNLYTNGTLVFHPDQTMAVGDNEGTWSQEGDTISYTYMASDGSEVEQTAIITTENEVTVLKGSNGSDYYSEDTVEDARTSRSIAVGETVSSDILEITLDDAQLSYYADESLELTENAGIFTSNKGNTLIRLDFTITNKDRTTLDTSLLGLYFLVLQNGTFSNVKGYDPSFPEGQFGLNYAYAFVSEPEGAFVANRTSNILLPPAVPIRVRMIGIANFEAENLSAPFYLIANIPNSDGDAEKFIYSVG